MQTLKFFQLNVFSFDLQLQQSGCNLLNEKCQHMIEISIAMLITLLALSPLSGSKNEKSEGADNIGLLLTELLEASGSVKGTNRGYDL